MKLLKESNEKFKLNYRYSSLLILSSLIGIGFLIRLYYIPFQVPISLDGIDYFVYTVVINKEGYFPTGYLSSNFGWSTFLSPIFSIMGNSEMLELMNVQRMVSCFISVLTAIPIYFICKTFFKRNIAILGAVLFLFEPRIIENSVLGISDPIFIFFVAVTIMFVFVKETKLFYLSFIFAALAGFTRYEGFLLIFPILITFFIRKDFQKISIIRVSLGVILFISIMFFINMTAYDQSNLNILSPIFGGVNYVSNHVLSDNSDYDDQFFGDNVENRYQVFVSNSITGYTKYLGWIMIPILGLFIIPGFFLTRKKVTKNKIIFLSFIIFISIASIYAYGRGIQETRYLYPLILIFVLFGCQFFNYISKKYDIKKIMIVVIPLIIVLSILFIEYDKIDYEYEREMYDATLFLVSKADGVNNYENGSKYVKVADLQNSWPELLSKGENKKMALVTKKFNVEGFDGPLEYIKFNKDKGLTHLLIKKGDQNKFFGDILVNEEKYSYLEKIYDSKDLGFKNQIKIFKINYNVFDLRNIIKPFFYRKD